MSRGSSDRLGDGLAWLGLACWRHPWRVLAVWGVAVVAAAFLSVLAPQRLLSGSGDISGSMSARVSAILASEFEGGDTQSLLLVMRQRGGGRPDGGWEAIEDALSDALLQAPGVASAASTGWLIDDPGAASRHGLVAVTLDSTNTLASEQQVEPLREAVRSTITALGPEGKLLDWAVTGRAAISHDVNVFSTSDTAQAEMRALPLAFAVLLYAFGSIVAGGLPLVLAVAARTMGLAAIIAIAGLMDVSNLAQSIVTMISLALGIDYSLFVYHRFRDLLTGGGQAEAALQGAMQQSGQVIVYSGLAVAIGMGALLATGAMQVVSIGLGGTMAVVFSVAASLTLLPALLALLSDRLRRKATGLQATAHAHWTRWGEWIVRHPLPAIGSSLAILALLAWPGLQSSFGFPEELPPELQSASGLTMLEQAGVKGLVSPVQVLISDSDGERVVNDRRVPELAGLIDALERDPRVAIVQAPSLRTGSRVFDMPINTDRGMVNHDRTRILLRVIPASTADLEAVRDLAHEIAERRIGGASILVGGQAQYFNDFEAEMIDSFAFVIVLVLALSGAALLAMLRAPLAAAKAITLNLLSVAAGYGMVVWVFQLGHGASILGLSAPTGVVTPSVPVVIFAVLFGLSMDYEIFLISRIRALVFSGVDNRTAIVAALADTGAVITQAAAIMALVFGAFAFSRLLLVQMIGLGLSVAIIVDVIIIRSVLGPALMSVAGRYNWWPNGGE